MRPIFNCILGGPIKGGATVLLAMETNYLQRQEPIVPILDFTIRFTIKLSYYHNVHHIDHY